MGKSAIGNWRRRGKVPPKQAIAIHLQFGIPLGGLAGQERPTPPAAAEPPTDSSSTSRASVSPRP
ncbi:helix-turn-helix domain-containing protein [Roseomonas sp. USHLN139]|uniref:helix-turn-helix domain-containing protein n=1 Tax=Roseomonas sp. USHLN139 TaxID=3081298 RepID=UPI003FA6C184